MVRFLCLLAAASLTAQAPESLPAANRVDFVETFHDIRLNDPYHWLENFDDPAAAAWIAAQDSYARSYLASRPGQERLRQRYRELSRFELLSVPQVVGGRYFYTKTTIDRPQPLLCLRRAAEATEEVWLDPASFGDPSVGVSVLGISPDGKAAVYALRRSGQDEVEVRVRDIEARKDTADVLPKSLYDDEVAFLPGREGFYYARRERDKGSRIWLHRSGTHSSKDTEIFGKGMDARVFLSPYITTDGRWLLVTASYGWARTEIWFADLTKLGDAPRLLTPGMDAQFSAVEAGPSKLLLVTSWKAPRLRALLVDLKQPAPGAWREIIPEAADVLEEVTVAGGRIYATYLHDVQSRIQVLGLDGKPAGDVPLPPGSSGGVFGRWDQDEIFISFNSFTVPSRIERMRAGTGERTLWYQPHVSVPATLELKQVWYHSKDGTRVPMYLVHSKELALDGKRPVLLTGYGGFNVAIQPGFNAEAVLWAESGGVWARPNLRGGSEFGEGWHRAGMLQNKQNVFDDFIGAAEWLIAQHYTSPAHLALSGTSNGGLLMGAALTQRPDLFRAVYCGYPDLDMVRYFRYTKNNNPPALLEYGDGSNPAHLGFLRSWSPYERVEEGKKYPAILFATGEGDTRVPPAQAVKMAAKVQWATRSGLPVLLRFDRKSGHAGGRTLDERIADNVAEQAFLMDAVR
jgi:prolyl oligopeptidase